MFNLVTPLPFPSFFLHTFSLFFFFRCTNGHSLENSLQTQPQNISPIATASMLGMPLPKSKYDNKPAPVGDIPPDNDIFGEDQGKFTDRKLQLYDGWLPLHYK